MQTLFSKEDKMPAQQLEEALGMLMWDVGKGTRSPGPGGRPPLTSQSLVIFLEAIVSPF